MKIITDIKVIDVDRDVYEILHCKPYETLPCYKNGAFEPTTATDIKELIRGKTFINYQGETIVVGWSKQVEDLLEVPISSLDKLVSDESKRREEILSLQRRLNNYNNIRFFKRLWRVLKGEKL